MRGRRRIVAAGAAIGAVTAAIALAGRGGSTGAPTARVEPRDLVVEAEVEGTLEAVETVGIGPPPIPSIWNFKISFLAPEGAEVRAGQPVVGFDTTDLQRELREKTGERDSAAKELEKRRSELAIERQDLELRLAEAEASLRRQALKLDVPEDLVSRHELESTRIDHALAGTEIEGLQESLRLLASRSRAELAALEDRRDRAARRVSELEENLARMQVRAPRDGTVIYTTGRGGEKRKVGDSVWRADTILEIPDLSRMRAKGQVDESQVGRLAVGQPVRLRLDAHPNHPVVGEIAAVRRAVRARAEGDPTRVVDVEIALAETDPERMRPGMRFRGVVELERRPGVVSVPLAAVTPTPAGPRVTVVGPLGERQIAPRLGRRDAHHVEVLEGLAEGDRVLLPAEDGT